jgi:hypothetical protein
VTIEDALYQLVGGDATIQSLLGSGDAIRLYAVQAPEGAVSTPPFAVRTTAQDNPITLHDQQPRLGPVDVTFACYDTTPEAAQAVADALASLLANYKGLVGTVYIDAVWSTGGHKSYDWETYLYCTEADFRMLYRT